MKKITLFLLLLVPVFGMGQEVTIPQTVTVAPGRLAAVEMSYQGDDFAYNVSPELDAFREYTTDPKIVRLRVLGEKPGIFQITAVATKAVDGKGKLSPFKTCLVVVGGVPVPPVVPPVVPPEVVPVPHPVPPAPTPSGPRDVLLIRETQDNTTSLARAVIALRSPSGEHARYFKEKGHGLWILDDERTDALTESWRPHFKDIALPALIIFDRASGKILYRLSMTQQATAADVLGILKAHGG